MTEAVFAIQLPAQSVSCIGELDGLSQEALPEITGQPIEIWVSN